MRNSFMETDTINIGLVQLEKRIQFDGCMQLWSLYCLN